MKNKSSVDLVNLLNSAKSKLIKADASLSENLSDIEYSDKFLRDSKLGYKSGLISHKTFQLIKSEIRVGLHKLQVDRTYLKSERNYISVNHNECKQELLKLESSIEMVVRRTKHALLISSLDKEQIALLREFKLT